MGKELLAYLESIGSLGKYRSPDNEVSGCWLSKVDRSYLCSDPKYCDILPILHKKGMSEVQAGKNIPEDGSLITACIGFCEDEQKWYGWSHRAIYGFGVGSEVKRGDCAYVATDKDDFLQQMVGFWSDENHENVKGEHSKQEIQEWVPIAEGEAELKPVDTGIYEDGVYVSWEYPSDTPNEKLRNTVSGSFSVYPDSYGNGEWKAETLDDAKQMAKDFAEGVN